MAKAVASGPPPMVAAALDILGVPSAELAVRLAGWEEGVRRGWVRMHKEPLSLDAAVAPACTCHSPSRASMTAAEPAASIAAAVIIATAATFAAVMATRREVRS